MGVITGSNENKFKSAEYIYSKIKREFKSFGGVNLLDDADFPLYTAEVLKKLGISVYKEDVAILKIINSRAKLPDDFSKLYAAYKVGKDNFQSDTRHLQNDYIFENDITCEILKRNKDCGIIYDCGENGDKIIEKIRIKQYVNDNEKVYNFSHPKLLHLSPNVKDKCANDCINMLVDSIHKSHSNEITINGKYILTNFTDGFIFLQYYAFPLDDEGLPMIPDILEVEKAIEWYIKHQILLNFWLVDDLTNAQNKWQKAEQEYEKWMAEARYISKLPSFSSMINSLRNTRGINKVAFFSQIDNKRI